MDPNTARLIAAAASCGPGERVLEIGAGLGSLTVALAAAGASVLAVEFDRGLVPALSEVVSDLDSVEVLAEDAMSVAWPDVLTGGPWKMVSNLPYNIATPLVLDMLEADLPIDLYLVMVQREVGERLAAVPGDEGYGAVSVKTAYLSEASLVRRVPPTVFWPRPKVESVLVRLIPRSAPPVDASREVLFRVVEEGFAQRRKTMANALRRMGLSVAGATAALERCGLASSVRAEELSLEDFARLSAEVSAGA
jgi:16S rRNA (adenine1518-N6/adenine1519-N6)-dimethyltransferase